MVRRTKVSSEDGKRSSGMDNLFISVDDPGIKRDIVVNTSILVVRHQQVIALLFRMDQTESFSPLFFTFKDILGTEKVAIAYPSLSLQG